MIITIQEWENKLINRNFSNISGDKKAYLVADLLRSGISITGLDLDLVDYNISDKGACSLAEALAIGKSPTGLQIRLYNNKICDKGAQALAEALNSGHCRFGTTIHLHNEKYNFDALTKENNESIHQAALGIAILIGGFSQRNMRVKASPLSRLPLDLIGHISTFLPGHISAIKVAAYLKKSFIRLMKTNSEFLQKYRSNNQQNQHLYDKQHGLSLWKSSGDNQRRYMNNYPIMNKRVIPRHSIK